MCVVGKGLQARLKHRHIHNGGRSMQNVGEGGGGGGGGWRSWAAKQPSTHSVPPPCTKCEKNSLSFFKGLRIALMGSLKTHCKSACPRAQH